MTESENQGSFGTLVHDALQPCPYLPGRLARLPLYRQRRPLTLEEADARFERSERRIGTCLYHTACPTCQACEGLRVPVADFRPSRSQRRVLARWAGRSRVDIGPPVHTDERLALYNRHKRERGLTDDEVGMDAVGYASWLVHSCLFTVEMTYWFDDQLVGVGIVDLGRHGASSVYFYFSPDHAALSPGVFSVLQEIELCRRTGRKWLYLGLYVGDCRHLAYKADFNPHERRVDGAWRRQEG
jgi:leucyl-tRNA---protein transferase